MIPPIVPRNRVNVKTENEKNMLFVLLYSTMKRTIKEKTI